MRIANRVKQIGKSAIHEMTRLAKEFEDVAFLFWAKPTSDTPNHVKQAAIRAIKDGSVGGYSESSGLLQLREAIVENSNVTISFQPILVRLLSLSAQSKAWQRPLWP